VLQQVRTLFTNRWLLFALFSLFSVISPGLSLHLNHFLKST
jgi:hypothetical protein